MRAIEAAHEKHDSLIIIEMDTPGGLDLAMRDIIKAILGSPVPVVTYVYPSGSRAASAGTYILYASHVAAMAPATNLGAATPVNIGPGAPQTDDKSNDKGNDKGNDQADDESEQKEAGKSESEEADSDRGGGTAMERKAINDAVAYIRGLAELRKRNAEWAEDAVRNGVSLNSNDALENNIIDIIATDVSDLLTQIDGRVVMTDSGEVVLQTAGLVLERVEPNWRTRVLATITDPNVALLLFMIGIYGLIFEGYNPGAIVPGVVGAISLLLALFAFQVLPVNYVGLLLIVLGLILVIAEVFVPSFGALGMGGVIAFIVGSIMLFDTDVPGFTVSRMLLGSIGFVSGLIVMAIIGVAVKARRAPIVSGSEQMLGSTGRARESFDREGNIFVHGEIWRALTSSPVNEGDAVRIVAMDGLTLHVEPAGHQED